MLLGHTRIYEEAQAGKLEIVKNGKSSGIRASEIKRYNASLPKADLAREAR